MPRENIDPQGIEPGYTPPVDKVQSYKGQISRRDFLKLAGMAAGAAFIPREAFKALALPDNFIESEFLIVEPSVRAYAYEGCGVTVWQVGTNIVLLENSGVRRIDGGIVVSGREIISGSLNGFLDSHGYITRPLQENADAKELSRLIMDESRQKGEEFAGRYDRKNPKTGLKPKLKTFITIGPLSDDLDHFSDPLEFTLSIYDKLGYQIKEVSQPAVDLFKGLAPKDGKVASLNVSWKTQGENEIVFAALPANLPDGSSPKDITPAKDHGQVVWTSEDNKNKKYVFDPKKFSWTPTPEPTPEPTAITETITIGENTYTATVTSDEAMEIPTGREIKWIQSISPSQNYTDIMAIGVPTGYVDRIKRMEIKDPDGPPIKIIFFRMKYFSSGRTIYANYAGVESDTYGTKITLGKEAFLVISVPLNEQYSSDTVSSLKKEKGLTDLETEIIYGTRERFSVQEIKKMFTSAKDGEILNFGFQIRIDSFNKS